MKKIIRKIFYSNSGFIENTLLFLVLGLTALAIPSIVKTLPTYTAGLTQQTSQIAGQSVSCGSKTCSMGQTCVGSSNNDALGTFCLTQNAGASGSYCGRPDDTGPNNSACASNYCNPSTLNCQVQPNCGSTTCSNNQTCVGSSNNDSLGTTCLTQNVGASGSYCGKPNNGGPNNTACASSYCNPSTLNCSSNTLATVAPINTQTPAAPINTQTPAAPGNGSSPVGGTSPLNPPIESNQCLDSAGKVATAQYLEPRCGGQKFDALKATPENNVYCGKSYSDVYTCGGREFTENASIDACNKAPWCPTSTSELGTATIKGIATVIPSGITYDYIFISWETGSANPTERSFNYSASNKYSFEGPVKTGTTAFSIIVKKGNQTVGASTTTLEAKNANETINKDFSVTLNSSNPPANNGSSCASLGGTCLGTVTQNSTPCTPSTGGSGRYSIRQGVSGCASPNPFCFVCERTAVTPVPNEENPGTTTTPQPTIKPGTGEACTSENTICGGNNSNSCLKSKDGVTLHCCRFTERFCEETGTCVNGGTAEFENCGKVHSTPTPTKIGAFDASTCNGAPGSAVNHCNGKNAAGATLPCCPGYHKNNPSSPNCACVPDTASVNTSQSIASESECSKNSDCKKINKNACVLNVRNEGVCK